MISDIDGEEKKNCGDDVEKNSIDEVKKTCKALSNVRTSLSGDSLLKITRDRAKSFVEGIQRKRLWSKGKYDETDYRLS